MLLNIDIITHKSLVLVNPNLQEVDDTSPESFFKSYQFV